MEDQTDMTDANSEPHPDSGRQDDDEASCAQMAADLDEWQVEEDGYGYGV